MTGCAADWAGARNLLGVRLDSLGDVLMMGPALGALAESVPGRQVTLLTSPSGAAAGRLMPSVSDVLVYAAPWMKATAEGDAAADLAMATTLRHHRFDAAVIFTSYSQSPLPAALLCHLAGIPLRLAHCRENPYHLLTHWAPETEPDHQVRHEVQRQLDLVATVGALATDCRLRVRVGPVARGRAAGLLAGLGVALGRWLVVHPGSTAAARTYPAEQFAAAVRLLSQAGLTVVFTGSAAEAPLVDRVRGAAGVPTHSLVGQLSTEELAAVLEAAPVLVANNTGPVHLAAAVGTPVVVLYALTNPQHTPWGVPHAVLNHDVPCRWCYKSVCPESHHHCLTLVEPAQVATAALDLLARSAVAP